MSSSFQSTYYTQCSSVNFSIATLKIPDKSKTMLVLMTMFADQKDELDFKNRTVYEYFSERLKISKRTAQDRIQPLLENNYIYYAGPEGRKKSHKIRVDAHLRSQSSANYNLKEEYQDCPKDIRTVIDEMKKDFPCHINKKHQNQKHAREIEMKDARIADLEGIVEFLKREFTKQREINEKLINKLLRIETTEQLNELKSHLEIVK